MRILITGITGFVGSHLAEYALGQGAEVCGTVRYDHAGEEMQNVAAIAERLTLVHGDLTDRNFVSKALAMAQPDVVFHLAAQSFVPESWRAPEYTLLTNVLPQLHLFELTRTMGLDPVIHVAGSSEEYGLVRPEECPIRETNPLRPLSPYAVSKVTQDMLAAQYWHSYQTRTVITRAFNHEGPRRGRGFVTSAFARQIARIEAGLQEPVIRVGSLTPVRDFTDVRDVVRAYWVAAQRCEHGTPYNIGSGQGRRIQDVLDTLLALSPARDRISLVEDPARMRPSDVMLLIADAGKFRDATGWEPLIPFAQTLADQLDYWRAEVAGRRDPDPVR